MDDTPNERRNTMSATRTPQVSIFGNLGSDPEVKTIAAKTVTREAYNPATDDVEERTFTTPARTFLVFSIGVNGTDGDGAPFTNWIRCVDWHSQAESYRTGDRVRVTGFFKIRNYIQEGEAKSIREFVVVETRLERKKAQEEDQAAA
jgi:single-stranded DNA-binding protein